MRVLFTALLLLSMLRGDAHAAGPEKPLVPLVVLIERNPWLHVIGSDSPSFVLYENGLVIFLRSKDQGKQEHVSVILDPEEKRQLLASLLPAPALDGLKPYYRLVYMTDQPTNVLVMWSQGKARRVGIYGSLRRTYAPDPEVDAEAPPPQLRGLVNKLIQFAHARAQPWHPEKVEMMMQPHEVDPNQAIVWPKDLPDLKHPTTIKRTGLSSIYIDHGRFLELHKIIQSGKSPLFLINGKTFAATYRLPFPAEAAWMR